jgi:hypothetical protein
LPAINEKGEADLSASPLVIFRFGSLLQPGGITLRNSLDRYRLGLDRLLQLQA